MDGTCDAYAILGVRAHADPAEIRTAYLELARQHHPDKSASVSAADRIREINLAYETLRDPALRRAWEMRRAARQPQKRTTTRVADVIDLDAFDARGDGGDLVFVYPCRCGQQYVVLPGDLQRGADHIACAGCSEVVRVVWANEEDAERA
ncbi:hypothetical protein MSPP1_003854 [Malassezia sp. CBS 17886]|nr:hypothetical protein MSPP1_003854 [Malassezia sp. CBS 17886]